MCEIVSDLQLFVDKSLFLEEKAQYFGSKTADQRFGEMQKNCFLLNAGRNIQHSPVVKNTQACKQTTFAMECYATHWHTHKDQQDAKVPRHGFLAQVKRPGLSPFSRSQIPTSRSLPGARM